MGVAKVVELEAGMDVVMGVTKVVELEVGMDVVMVVTKTAKVETSTANVAKGTLETPV